MLPAFFNRKQKNMLKTYEAPRTILSDINIIHKGKLFRLNFQPISVFAGSRTGKGSMLITNDPEIQEAIEHSAYFHREVFIFKEEEEKIAHEEQEDETNLTVVNVTSPSDARDYLSSNFGIDKKRISTLKQIGDVARKCGIIFEGI